MLRAAPQLVVAALLSIAADPRAHAQCPAWAEGFDLPGLPLEVDASTTFDDGGGMKLYVAGSTDDHAGGRDDVVLRLDGDRWTQVGGVFDGFAGAQFGALAVYDDGSGPALYAGGRFTSAGGTFVSNVAKWTGTAWVPLGLGVDGAVDALFAYDDGGGAQLYVGGGFSSAGGVAMRGLARWNGTTWSSLGSGIDTGSAGAFATFDDGTGTALYVGGGMRLVPSGITTSVARWDGTSLTTVGDARADVALTSVRSFAVHDDGTGVALHAAGSCSALPVPVRSAVARWSGSAWQPVGPLTSTSHTVWALASFDDGNGARLYAGGQLATGAGTPGSHFIVWDGTDWSAAGAPIPTLNVRALVPFDDGSGTKLYVSGFFFRAGDRALFHIGRWDGTELSWPGHGFAGDIGGLAFFDDGSGPSLVVATDWIAGALYEAGIVRWNGAGWTRLGLPNDRVRALAVYDDAPGGAPPMLYAGGHFTAVDGTPASYVARYDGTSWSSVGGGMNLHVYALTVHDDGSGPVLVAAGEFTDAGGVALSNVATWDGTSWSPLGGGIPTAINGQSIFALASVPDGVGGAVLYAAGNFTLAGGAPAQRIARWDGASWQPVGVAPNDTIWTLESVAEGASHVLYAGGEFSQIGGVAAKCVARFDGNAWSALGSGVGTLITDAVLDLAVFDDGSGPKLYASGELHREPSLGAPRDGLQVWDGTTWSLPAEPVNDFGGLLLATPEPDGSRSLWVAGDFSHVGDVPSRGIARLPTCAPTITSFCAGDGLDPFVANGCPCANTGGAGRGCAWSGNALGASLTTSGAPNPDTLVLHASGMPAAGTATLFWKGDARLASDLPWGDGIRCVAGNLVRLGNKSNVAGAAQYPEAGNASISVRGGTRPGSGAVGYYQTSYRNAASFCTPETYNATNGVIVVW